MARRARYEREAEPEPGLDISSLIDVSFLLITFFLVTSTLSPREVDVGISLPSDQAVSEPSEQRPLTLKLNEDGTVIAEPSTNPQSLGRAVNFEFPELKARLSAYNDAAKQLRQKPFIVLQADDNANQQMLMDVFNVIYDLGITNVTLSGFSQ
jgi:biopolymer transport protein ExbD